MMGDKEKRTWDQKFQGFVADIFKITSEVVHNQKQQEARINAIGTDVSKKLAIMGEKKLENFAYGTLSGRYLCKVDADIAVQRQISPEEKKARMLDFTGKLSVLMSELEIGRCSAVMMVAYSDKYKDNPGAFASDNPSPPTNSPNQDGEGGLPAYL